MEIIFAPVDLIHVCEILKLLYSDMGKKLTGTDEIRKVLTSLRKIASQSLGVKGRLGVQKQTKKMFKVVGASRGEERFGKEFYFNTSPDRVCLVSLI